MFFGEAAAPRQALHSRTSGQRMFSRQHLSASGAFARFRPAAPSPFFESVLLDDVLADAFHDAGSARQSAPPVEGATHSVRVGLADPNAGRDGFRPTAVRLQNGDHLSDLPGTQLLLDPAHVRSSSGGRFHTGPTREVQNSCPSGLFKSFDTLFGRRRRAAPGWPSI